MNQARLGRMYYYKSIKTPVWFDNDCLLDASGAEVWCRSPWILTKSFSDSNMIPEHNPELFDISGDYVTFPKVGGSVMLRVSGQNTFKTDPPVYGTGKKFFTKLTYEVLDQAGLATHSDFNISTNVVNNENTHYNLKSLVKFNAEKFIVSPLSGADEYDFDSTKPIDIMYVVDTDTGKLSTYGMQDGVMVGSAYITNVGGWFFSVDSFWRIGSSSSGRPWSLPDEPGLVKVTYSDGEL